MFVVVALAVLVVVAVDMTIYTWIHNTRPKNDLLHRQPSKSHPPRVRHHKENDYVQVVFYDSTNFYPQLSCVD